MKKIACIILILLLVSNNDLFAQAARQYSFTHYTTANGLASNQVYNITQDKLGFVWLATVNGLQRFDGKEFITFRHNRNIAGSLPSNNVAGIFSDSKGRFWVVNDDNSVGLFHTSTFEYQNVPVNASPKTYNIFFPYRLLEDWRGKIILMIVTQGIFELDENSMVFKPSSLRVPEKWHVLELAADNYNKCYWLGADSGIARIDPLSGRIYTASNNTIKDPILEAFGRLENVGGIRPAVGGKIFSCNNWPRNSGNPLFHWFDRQTRKATTQNIGNSLFPGYHEIKGQFIQSNGQLWVYGLPFAASYDPESEKLNVIGQSAAQGSQLRFDNTHDMFEDRQQNLWIATSDGVYVFNPVSQPFNAYHLLRPGATQPKEGPVTNIVQLSNGNIWVATWGKGLYSYDRNMAPIAVPAALDKWKDVLTIWYIHQHSKTGLVFMGEQGGGLKIYDPRTGKLWNTLMEVFEKRTIRQITEDQEGNLWFGTQGGLLVKWDHKESGGDPEKGYSSLMRLALIQKLYTDTDGTIWIGSLGRGLYQLDPKKGKILDHITSKTGENWQLCTDSPTDIIRYNDSLLIVAGNSVSILNTKNKTSQIISLDEGLPSNTVHTVQKDTSGILWLGLQNGLCRWNFEKGRFTLFDRRDGISFDNFTSGGAFSLNKKQLAFTTGHNFLVFDPSRVLNATAPPKVTLTDLHVMNRRVPIDSILQEGELKLDPQNNSITIDYASLQFLDHDQLSFYHMLEGLDKDWVKSTTNKAIYNYLPYRNYTFRVKCVNGDGVDSREITSLAIQVKPPFWRSYWFLGMMVFLGVGFLYWLDKLRMQKLRATESIRTRIATSLTEDLTNSLSSINISSELAKTKLENDSHRTRDYIHHISETSNRMTQAMYDMVWSINPHNDQMHKTLERMKHYATEQESIYNINITIDADPSIAEKESDMEHRYELLSIFKEAIANAVKHSGGKNIHVQLRLRKQKLLLLVQDDGKGFELTTVARGRGINDMKRRAEAIGAQLTILSEINTGTLVKLEMNLKY